MTIDTGTEIVSPAGLRIPYRTKQERVEAVRRCEAHAAEYHSASEATAGRKLTLRQVNEQSYLPQHSTVRMRMAAEQALKNPTGPNPWTRAREGLEAVQSTSFSETRAKELELIAEQEAAFEVTRAQANLRHPAGPVTPAAPVSPYEAHLREIDSRTDLTESQKATRRAMALKSDAEWRAEQETATKAKADQEKFGSARAYAKSEHLLLMQAGASPETLAASAARLNALEAGEISQEAFYIEGERLEGLVQTLKAEKLAALEAERAKLAAQIQDVKDDKPAPGPSLYDTAQERMKEGGQL
jgi:hypothetical protein